MNKVQGNLLELAASGEFDIIIQGCNCFNTMGSGIARQIREYFPSAYEADKRTKIGDRNKLGTYTSAIIKINSDVEFTIINAYTQYDYNRKDEHEDVFEYTAFKLILEKLAKEYPNSKFGFPRIGQGLAGGDKDRIMQMIEDFSFVIENSGGSVTLVELP